MRRVTFLLVIAASMTGALAVGATAFAVAILPAEVDGVVQNVAPIVTPRDSPVAGGDISESPADPAQPPGPESAPQPTTPPGVEAPEIVAPLGAEELAAGEEGTGNTEGNNGAGVGNGGGNGTGNEGNGVGPGNDRGVGDEHRHTDEVELSD
jgi:hypothetical protein